MNRRLELLYAHDRGLQLVIQIPQPIPHGGPLGGDFRLFGLNQFKMVAQISDITFQRAVLTAHPA